MFYGREVDYDRYTRSQTHPRDYIHSNEKNVKIKDCNSTSSSSFLLGSYDQNLKVNPFLHKSNSKNSEGYLGGVNSTFNRGNGVNVNIEFHDVVCNNRVQVTYLSCDFIDSIILYIHCNAAHVDSGVYWFWPAHMAGVTCVRKCHLNSNSNSTFIALNLCKKQTLRRNKT